MEFGPQPSQVSSHEKQKSPEVSIPSEIAWPFQMNLFITHFTNKEGEKITELDEEVIRYWADTYGEAFRTFCKTHQDISKHIVDGMTTDEEVNEMVAYIQSHPSNDDEIQQMYASLEKYKH
jgi:hypothetical protein